MIFLGTGGATNLERFQSAVVVEALGVRVLLDTGGGLDLVRRLIAAAIEPASIGHIVLSHRHLDHIGGLEPFLLTVGLAAFRRGEAPPAVSIYASAETTAAVRSVMEITDASGAILLCAERLNWIVPRFGERLTLAPGLTLTLSPVDHLPPGGGAAAAILDVAGRRIVYSGDTRPSATLVEAARGADLLIHEVGGLDIQRARIHVPGHSTAGDAGRVAAEAGVRVLALTHVPPCTAIPPADLLAEARHCAPGIEVVLAEDGLVLTP